MELIFSGGRGLTGGVPNGSWWWAPVITVVVNGMVVVGRTSLWVRSSEWDPKKETIQELASAT